MFKTVKTIALAGTMLATAAGVASAAEINVGSAAGVTGPIAEFVVPIVKARELAAQHVNEQGGLLDGDTMNLVLADSQCDPKAGVDAGTKLVNVDQVVAIVGASCSGATNGMTQSVTIPAGVVSVSDSATAPSIASPSGRLRRGRAAICSSGSSCRPSRTRSSRNSPRSTSTA